MVNATCPSVHPVEAPPPQTHGEPQNPMPQGRMNDIPGMPGTRGGLTLRLNQFVFALVAGCVMASTHATSTYTILRYLSISLVLFDFKYVIFTGFSCFCHMMHWFCSCHGFSLFCFIVFVVIFFGLLLWSVGFLPNAKLLVVVDLMHYVRFYKYWSTFFLRDGWFTVQSNTPQLLSKRFDSWKERKEELVYINSLLCLMFLKPPVPLITLFSAAENIFMMPGEVILCCFSFKWGVESLDSLFSVFVE